MTSNDLITVSIELKIMWKEAARYLPGICLEGLRKIFRIVYVSAEI
jgi:hypothetical protein